MKPPGATAVLALAVSVAVWAGTALGGNALVAADALPFGLVLAAFLLDFVGPLLELSDPLLDASPFRHLAEVPVAVMDVAVTAIMLAIAVLAAALGFAAFRRRDLKEA